MFKAAKSGSFTGRISNCVDRGNWTETYGYDVVEGFKTVGFRSNAPAGPGCTCLVEEICAFDCSSSDPI